MNQVENVEASTTDNLDLVDFLLEILRKWKLIIFITTLAAIASVLIALAIPKIYHVSATLTFPNEYNVHVIKENLGIDKTTKSVFHEYYDFMRNKQNLEDFVFSRNYAQKLFPNAKDELSMSLSVTNFVTQFQIRIVEPKAVKGTFVYDPDIFTITTVHRNESLLVELTNEYVDYVNDLLRNDMVQTRKLTVVTELNLVDREISNARSAARLQREHMINRIEKDNEQKLIKFEQDKQLLIELENASVKTKIMVREENNRVAKLTLLRDRRLELEKAKVKRQNQIVVTKEALSIAKTLGIEFPTSLDELSPIESTTDSDTNINLNRDASRPLYLMGTKYLNTLIEVLDTRQADDPFLDKINEIDAQIAQIDEDVELQKMKEQQTSAPFLQELNAINRQIEAVKNDTVLAELKSRVSDDPFIDALPGLLATKERLNSLPLVLDGVDFFTPVQYARLTNKAVKPNRPAIAILGTLVGGVIAVFIASLLILIDRKREDD